MVILVLKILIAIVMILGLIGNCFTQKGEEEFRRWGFPPYFRFLIGGLELVAAALIFVPGAALAGMLLAAILMAGAVGTLLLHREYSHALPPAITLALIAAAVAMPGL